MTALGLAVNQLGIGTNIYGTTSTDGYGYKTGLRQPVALDATGQRVIHQPFLCTTFPRKEGGPVPATVTGVLFLIASSVDSLIADIRNYATLRKLSFIDNGIEKYVWVYSGDALSWPALAPGGIALLYRDVHFSFTAYKTQIYNATTDATIWGG